VETISFNKIKSLFDDTWDVGVISADKLLEVSLMPIKGKFHYKGADFTNDIHFEGLHNTVILVKAGHTWDYTHYDEAINILTSSELTNWFQVYTNFKEATLRAGLGVRARNSLIYSYKFGFDCHIAAFAFTDTIVDLPTNKRHNKKLWNKCRDCDDCITACPVGAINGKEEPYWLNSTACDNFIGSSDHPTIPSIKKFWHKNVYPELPKEIVDNIRNVFDLRKVFGKTGHLPWDRNGYAFDGNIVTKDGEPINIPFCRECTSQPRCSKWNGKYPYDEIFNQQIKTIKFYDKREVNGNE
jgi:ferredoxin